MTSATVVLLEELFEEMQAFRDAARQEVREASIKAGLWDEAAVRVSITIQAAKEAEVKP